MNHPTNEEWGLYLFGEAPRHLNHKLRAHLKQCSECAEELAAMKETMRKLDVWEVPARQKRLRPLAPVLKLAMAAAIVLGLGFGIGRLTSPVAVDAEQLRAELRSSIADLEAAAERDAVDWGNVIASTEARLREENARGLRTLGRELIEAVNAGREQDRRALQAVLDQVKEQREADYISLRRDLETLASTADQEIQQARLKLFELAAASNANQ